MPPETISPMLVNSLQPTPQKSRTRIAVDPPGKVSRCLSITVFMALMLLHAGCLNWPAGWHRSQPAGRPDISSADAQDLLDTLRQQDLDTAPKVRQAIAQLQQIPGHSPVYMEAQTMLGQLELLQGAAFEGDQADQRAAYVRALQAAEKALYTLPAFRQQIDSGKALWEAHKSVPVAHFEPLHIWTTAIFYLYRDVFSTPARIVNYRYLKHAYAILDDLHQRAPDWREGSLLFSKAIYFLALPESLGGDRVKAKELADQAVNSTRHHLLPRWGRAKYFVPHFGTPETFREDLQWVIDQSPADLHGPHAWNLYFQREARTLLQEQTGNPSAP